MAGPESMVSAVNHDMFDAMATQSSLVTSLAIYEGRWSGHQTTLNRPVVRLFKDSEPVSRGLFSAHQMRRSSS